MSTPAHKGDSESRPNLILVRPGHGQESQAQGGRIPAGEPERNRDEPPQTTTPIPVRNSGRNITLSDLPGDLGSITAIWTGRPDALHDITRHIAAARRDNATPTDKITAAWSIATLAPRTLLHLTSWTLADPLRTLLAIVAIAITALSL
jgi:hypothetical protein